MNHIAKHDVTYFAARHTRSIEQLAYDGSAQLGRRDAREGTPKISNRRANGSGDYDFLLHVGSFGSANGCYLCDVYKNERRS
jgi:hypothetical protein